MYIIYSRVRRTSARVFILMSFDYYILCFFRYIIARDILMVCLFTLFMLVDIYAKASSACISKYADTRAHMYRYIFSGTLTN